MGDDNIDGTLSVSVCDLEDKPLLEQKVKIEMLPNENRKYVVEGLSEYLLNADLQKVYVKLELTEGETLIAERICHFSAFFE